MIREKKLYKEKVWKGLKENEEENAKKLDIYFYIDRTDLYMQFCFPETTNGICGNSKCEEYSGYKNRRSSFYGKEWGRLYRIALLAGA